MLKPGTICYLLRPTQVKVNLVGIHTGNYHSERKVTGNLLAS